MARQRRPNGGKLTPSRSAPLKSDAEAQEADAPPTATLYTAELLPDRWVGTDGHGALVHWPAVPGGWAKRTPFVGERRHLREVTPALARGSGWPGAGAGRRRLAGEVGQPLTIRLDDTRRGEAQAIADRQRQSLSEFVREAIDLAIARGSTR